MITIPAWLVFSVSALIIILLIVILGKLSSTRNGETEKMLREELRASRQEATDSARSLRQEVTKTQKDTNDSVIKVIGEMNKSQQDGLHTVILSRRQPPTLQSCSCPLKVCTRKCSGNPVCSKNFSIHTGWLLPGPQPCPPS